MRTTNLLAAALDDSNRDHAVTAICDALGIDNDFVADCSLPADWSDCDREQRARLLAEWLSNELHALSGGVKAA